MQPYQVDDWAVTELGDAELGDARRTKRLVHLATVRGAQPTASLPDATDAPATRKAAYRCFANDAIDPAQILASHTQATRAPAQHAPGPGRPGYHLPRLDPPSGHHWAGPLVHATQQGLLAHTTLALTPDRVPLGILAQAVWARAAATFAQQPDHKQRPISEKESQKWLTSRAAVAELREACPTP